MQNSSSFLQSFKTLSRAELKKIVGGVYDDSGGTGGCGIVFPHNGTRYVTYAIDENGDGFTKDDAIRKAAELGYNWCCASCSNFETY